VYHVIIKEKYDDVEAIHTEKEEAVKTEKRWRRSVEEKLSKERKESARLKKELCEKEKRIAQLAEKLRKTHDFFSEED